MYFIPKLCRLSQDVDEYKGSVNKETDISGVATATFWLGIGAGILASTLQKGQQIHTVSVQFNSGNISLLQIDDRAFSCLQSILYDKPTGIDPTYNGLQNNILYPEKELEPGLASSFIIF